MDRCRCADYEAAVKKIKFFTLGTYRPDIIDNYDRGEYFTTWVRHPVLPCIDINFRTPKAHKRMKPEDLPQYQLSERVQKIEKMWCPFMSPVKKYAD